MTQSRIEKVEINMAEIKTDITYLKNGMDKIENKLDRFINSADIKYASKELEEIVSNHTNKLNVLDKKIIRYVSYASGIIAVLLVIINLIANKFI